MTPRLEGRILSVSTTPEEPRIIDKVTLPEENRLTEFGEVRVIE